MPRKSTVPRKIARGDQGDNVASHVGNVLVGRKATKADYYRYARPADLMARATIGGATLGLSDVLIRNPSFRQGVKEIAAGGLAFAAGSMWVLQ